LRLLPDTTNLAVVVGNSTIERFWTEEFRRAFQPFANHINIEWFNDLTFDKMLDRAASMPPRSAILWVLLSEDTAGVPYAQDQALEKIREVSAAPIFGIGDYEMGRGIVGGPLLQTQEMGRKAAEVALRILKGENPDSIKTAPVLFGPPVYDWRELQRWKISEDRLPPGSIVQFREPTIWEQYRWLIAAVSAVIAGQALLLIYVLFQSRRRRVAEAEAAEQRREVAHLMRVSVMGELSGAIAHEMNQPLTAILSNAQAALHLLKEKSLNLPEIQDAINDIVHANNRAGEVIERLRTLLKKGERKTELININELVQSTIALLHSELVSRQIIVSTRLASSMPLISGDPVQLQQVLLNLLMNAMDAMSLTPHEQRHITVRTRASQSGTAEVQIRDHGCGIAHSQQTELFKPFFTSKANGLGLGLTICSTIAQAHGGRLTLANHDKGGAIAVFSLPGLAV
jgi:signal transduction histidine kinase